MSDKYHIVRRLVFHLADGFLSLAAMIPGLNIPGWLWRFFEAGRREGTVLKAGWYLAFCAGAAEIKVNYADSLGYGQILHGDAPGKILILVTATGTLDFSGPVVQLRRVSNGKALAVMREVLGAALPSGAGAVYLIADTIGHWWHRYLEEHPHAGEEPFGYRHWCQMVEPRRLKTLLALGLADKEALPAIREVSLGSSEDLSPLHKALSGPGWDYLWIVPPGWALAQGAREAAGAFLASRGGGIEVLYTDNDHFNLVGGRKDPRFLPDFLPDFFTRTFYTGPCVLLSRRTLEEALRDREAETVEALMYRLLARRALEPSRRSTVAHVPAVLCRRIGAAGDPREDLLPPLPARELEAFLNKNGWYCGVSIKDGVCDLTWPMEEKAGPDACPAATIVIPTRDAESFLRRCVDSIQSLTSGVSYEILVINNQSRDEAALSYLEALGGQAGVRVLDYDRPFNFAGMMNFAAKEARGTVLVLLNNDTQVLSPGWLERMISNALRDEVACVGAKLLYPDGLVQHAGIVLGAGGLAEHAFKFYAGGEAGYLNRLKVSGEYAAVTAAALAVRKDVYLSLGGMDEGSFAVAFNDLDLCLKAVDRGYRNLYLAEAVLVHHESKTRGPERTGEARRRLEAESALAQERWHKFIQADPCGSPAVSRVFPGVVDRIDLQVETLLESN